MFYETIDTYQGYKLVKRPDTPHYYIYWYVESVGKVRRESTGTGDRDDAFQRLKAFVDARLQKTVAHDDSLCLLDVLADYVEHGLAFKPSRGAGVNALKHWTLFFEGEDLVYVGELTLEAQERYVSWRRRDTRHTEHGVSDGTIRRELGVLRAALSYARRHGRLREVPYIMDLREPPPRERYLTPREFQRLLAECKQTPHLWLFTLLATHTMQRPGAVLELTAGQIDLERNRINFLPPGTVQSQKRRPVVPITATLRPHLHRAIENSASGHIIEWKGQPVKCVRIAFRKAAKRANLKDVTPYTLRHTGATLAAAAGVPLRQIAGMLGHSELRTTERYAKHSPDFLADVADALNSVLSP
ncbi:MAG: site-specific integrase [Planctomycetota bacterium]